MIRVGFSRPKKHKFPIFSWAIRFIENTKYSHTFIKWDSKYLDRDIVYEASGTSVSFIEGKRFDNISKTIHLFEIECSFELKKKVVQKAMDMAGTPYGLKQILGILIVKCYRLFGKDIKNPFSDGNKTWICSELVLELLKDLDIKFNINSDNITPRDIYEGLNQSPNPKVKRIY